jgi:CPA2 family monovalent cation:H+ antiporter-2
MKFGGNILGSIIFRQKRGKAIRSAFTLSAPRGEFSIVIIKTGVDIGAVSTFLFPLIGVISIVTAFITPFMIKASDKVIPIFEKKNV